MLTVKAEEVGTLEGIENEVLGTVELVCEETGVEKERVV